MKIHYITITAISLLALTFTRIVVAQQSTQLPLPSDSGIVINSDPSVEFRSVDDLSNNIVELSSDMLEETFATEGFYSGQEKAPEHRSGKQLEHSRIVIWNEIQTAVPTETISTPLPKMDQFRKTLQIASFKL